MCFKRFDLLCEPCENNTHISSIVDIVTFHLSTLVYVADKIQAGDLHQRLQWGADGNPL